MAPCSFHRPPDALGWLRPRPTEITPPDSMLPSSATAGLHRQGCSGCAEVSLECVVVCVKFCKLASVSLLVLLACFSLAAGAVGAVGNAQRFPSRVGRRGFIAAFHTTAASIA